MSLIGNLIVDICVKTDRLKKGFDKTRKSTSGFVTGLSSMKGVLLSVGDFLAGGVIVAGLKPIVSEQLGATDKTPSITLRN